MVEESVWDCVSGRKKLVESVRAEVERFRYKAAHTSEVVAAQAARLQQDLQRLQAKLVDNHPFLQRDQALVQRIWDDVVAKRKAAAIPTSTVNSTASSNDSTDISTTTAALSSGAALSSLSSALLPLGAVADEDEISLAIFAASGGASAEIAAKVAAARRRAEAKKGEPLSASQVDELVRKVLSDGAVDSIIGDPSLKEMVREIAVMQEKRRVSSENHKAMLSAALAEAEKRREHYSQHLSAQLEMKERELENMLVSTGEELDRERRTELEKIAAAGAQLCLELQQLDLRRLNFAHENIQESSIVPGECIATLHLELMSLMQKNANVSV